MINRALCRKEHIRQTFFSANLHCFLPHIPWEEHTDYYEVYRSYHRKRTVSLPQIDKQALALMVSAIIQGPPGLVTLFHLGDHARIPLLLAESGLVFDILIDRQVYQRFAEILEQWRRYYGHTGQQIRYWFSDDRMVLLHLRKALQEGRHILIFADGNSGSGERAVADMVSVPFLSSQLWVRKGIGFLSHLLHIPIYPVINMGTADRPALCVMPVIEADRTMARDVAAAGVMSGLYSHLSARLLDQPMHWECWGYLHRNGMIRPAQRPSLGTAFAGEIRPGQKGWANQPWVTELEWGDVSIYLDKKRYRAFRL